MENLISFIVLLFVFFLLTNGIYVGFKYAPFCPTPKRMLKKAFKEAGLKPGEVFYDLGAGDGRSLIIAARNFKANTRGFEMSLFRFILSKINIFILAFGRKVRLYWKDAFLQDLSDADVIFLWFTPPTHAKLEAKLNRELKAGTRVLTYSSPLLFWEPIKIVQGIKKDGKVFIYIKE